MRKIVLASASLRRKQLMEMIGLKFEVVESNINEVMDKKLNPQTLAKKLSFEKATNVAKNYKDALIIGADTFVIVNGEFLGKAHSKKQAEIMLGKLSGKMHKVITGFTVIDTKTDKIISRSIASKVYFKNLTAWEINTYINSGEPLEKAGAYAIQGLASKFIKKIEGDYFNIVGLPLFALVDTLKNFGYEV